MLYWQAYFTNEDITTAVIESSTSVLRAFLITAVVVLIFFVFARLIKKMLYPRLENKFNDTKHRIILILLGAFKKPIAAYLKVACLLMAVTAFAYTFPAGLLPSWLTGFVAAIPAFLIRMLRVFTVFCLAWGLAASSDITSLIFKRTNKQLEIQTSKSASQFLGAIYKVIIISVAAVIILSEFNYDINGLITGLGLGGLTVALAAQNVAANFVGGLVIVLERPFEIGDSIATPDVTGTVEAINLRSTSIRTSDGAITVVPNSTLSDSVITNWTDNLQRRRANYQVALAYSCTQEGLQALTAKIRQLLDSTDGIENNSSLVRFTDFDNAALNLTLTYFTVPDYGKHMEIKESINLQLVALIAKTPGVALAVPARNVSLAGSPAQNDTTQP